MEIVRILRDKRRFLHLLLMADEQENMVEKYLDRGDMYVLFDGKAVCECVVTDEGGGVLEIKNIATLPESRNKGYAKAMIEYVAEKYADSHRILQVGTGDSPLTIPFYEKCGFEYSHTLADFFTDNYDHPIYECGVRLSDMVYLRRPMKKADED